jgi:hypothetical protein
MKLYAVTTIHEKVNEKGTHIDSDRCVAICSTVERARQIVETNECDIWETCYNLVVIEPKEIDVLYATNFGRKRRYWYEWQGGQSGHYVSINCPERYKNVVGFGIG